MDYESRNHSKYLLMYHLIFVTKYRKNVLIELGSVIKDNFKYISDCSDFEIIEMESDIDHIHLLVKSSPKISVLQIVKRLKQMSTNYIWKHYSTMLKQCYWKQNILWSKGYFSCSIGNISKETIRQYIKSQG